MCFNRSKDEFQLFSSLIYSERSYKEKNIKCKKHKIQIFRTDQKSVGGILFPSFFASFSQNKSGVVLQRNHL